MLLESISWIVEIINVISAQTKKERKNAPSDGRLEGNKNKKAELKKYQIHFNVRNATFHKLIETD